MADLIITLLPVSLSQKTSSTHSFGVDVNPVRCLLTAEPDRAEMPSQMEHAMETMMFTFHKFAGDKGYLTKEDLRVLMEKEFPGFLEVSAERLGGDGRETRFLGPGSPSPPPRPTPLPGEAVTGSVAGWRLFVGGEGRQRRHGHRPRGARGETHGKMPRRRPRRGGARGHRESSAPPRPSCRKGLSAECPARPPGCPRARNPARDGASGSHPLRATDSRCSDPSDKRLPKASLTLTRRCRASARRVSPRKDLLGTPTTRGARPAFSSPAQTAASGRTGRDSAVGSRVTRDIGQLSPHIVGPQGWLTRVPEGEQRLTKYQIAMHALSRRDRSRSEAEASSVLGAGCGMTCLGVGGAVKGGSCLPPGRGCERRLPMEEAGLRAPL